MKYVIPFVASWACMAFIQWEPNPAAWGSAERFFVVFCSLLCCGFVRNGELTR